MKSSRFRLESVYPTKGRKAATHELLYMEKPLMLTELSDDEHPTLY
jgi:hypothetical protein